MMQRCTNSRAASYHRYGGRGISVCERWTKFANFLVDMGERPDGSSLDRIDPNGNYEPANCRWASRQQQQRNRNDNRTYTWRGETLVLQEWAARTGFTYEVLRARHRAKWSAEAALTTEVSKSNSVRRAARVYPERNAAGQFVGGGQ